MQLNAQKLDIIEMLIGIDNEKTLSEISSFVRKSTHDDFERIPGLAYTLEERIASVRESEEAILRGDVISQEDLEREILNW